MIFDCELLESGKIMNKELSDFKKKMRQAFADYYASKGCSCCQDKEKHDKAYNRIGKMLGVKKFVDKSGYNFWKYQTKEKE